ncbi:PREDICTED: alanine aminotransferase 2-like [Rhagoletis zephyria]|uniref:alanine aminotransferase 2-like n=1 Tax=Rhagoletis zephyria TaxID=28612 RepID=UPI00081154C4|nr:PREDICTED: alanine aminotransferase 2-like [Rhagoletis zephyria]
MSENSKPVLSLSNINENIVKMEYAVRGPIPARAVELIRELKAGAQLPFTEVIRANIGDCHMMGEKGITFIRQVLSACLHPEAALNDPSLPEDVKERVRTLLGACGGGSVGSYSDSAGIEIIRRHVAEYISERDGGVPSDWQNVVLTSGASEGVKALFALLNSPTDGIPTGIMVPIPQYPLYSATISELGMHQISYYLDEENEWALDINELDRALREAEGTCKPKVLVVINPGNPTGSVLTKENIAQIIKFARANNLLIVADEVYQHNIWKEGAAFFSFKQVMAELGVKLELASLMSASKGYMGECGIRGGYMEMEHFDPAVKAVFFKQISARLCSPVIGQCAIDCIVRPPREGDPSYELFQKEKTAVLASLKGRAQLTTSTLNSLEGVRTNPVAGAMYSFPRISIPEAAVRAAEAVGQKPDFFYVKALLEETGICVVPGSGFGQIPGTWHFRTTILPQPDTFARMMDRFKAFHLGFLQKYQS